MSIDLSAKQAAVLCALTYSSSDELQAGLDELNATFNMDQRWNLIYTSVDVHPDTDSYYGLAFQNQKGQIVIANRGSATRYDWLVSDGDIANQDKPDAFDAAENFAQAVEDKFLKPDSQIYEVGHSLGGSEAQYVAAVKHWQGLTFSAPGVQWALPGAQADVLNYCFDDEPVGHFGTPIGTTIQVARDNFTQQQFESYGGAGLHSIGNYVEAFGGQYNHDYDFPSGQGMIESLSLAGDIASISEQPSQITVIVKNEIGQDAPFQGLFYAKLGVLGIAAGLSLVYEQMYLQIRGYTIAKEAVTGAISSVRSIFYVKDTSLGVTKSYQQNLDGTSAFSQHDATGFQNLYYQAANQTGTVTGATFSGSAGALSGSTTGLIQALNGALLNITDGTVLTNGKLLSSYGGHFETSGSSLLSQVTLAAGTPLTVGDGSLLNLSGTIVNNGTITLANGMQGSSIYLAAATTLAGTGSIVLGGAASYLEGSTTQGQRTTLAIGAGQTVTGAGTIDGAVVNYGVVDGNSAAGALSFNGTNNGLLEATAGGELDAGTDSFPGVLTNRNVIKADGGTVRVVGNIVQTSAGVLEAVNGGIVIFDGGASGSLTGGTLAAQSGSGFECSAGAQGTLTNVSIASGALFAFDDNSEMTFSGTIVNDGSLSLASAEFGASIDIESPTTLSGAGTVTLAGPDAYISADARLTIGAAQTVEGSGRILGNVVNNGTIDADRANALQIAFALTNRGILEATKGGELDLQQTIDNQGSIEAVDGGTIVIDSAGSGQGSIKNGTLIGLTGGLIETASHGTALLVGVTVTAGTMYVGVDGSATDLSDDPHLPSTAIFTNDGTFALGAIGGNGASLNALSPLTLGGSGTVQMNNAGDLLDGAGGFVIGASQTVKGCGLVAEVVNYGTISADRAGAALKIEGSFSNYGTLEADGGTLTLNYVEIDQSSSGVLEAQNGGQVLLIGAADSPGIIKSGRLVGQSGGVFETPVGATGTLVSVTVTSGTTYLCADGSTTNLDADPVAPAKGVITNDGTFALGAIGGNGASLNALSPLTLGGSGTVQMNNAGDLLDGAGGFVIGASQTVKGCGLVAEVVNYGTISADRAGAALKIEGSFSNYGTLEADGGTLTISGGVENFRNLRSTNRGKIEIQAAIGNSGRVVADGGDVIASGELDGNLTVANGGVLELAAASMGAITFSGAVQVGTAVNTLKLDDVSDFSGSVAGFVSGDRIDLAGARFSSAYRAVFKASATGGTLEVVDAANASAVVGIIALSGGFASSFFALTSDGGTGTDIAFMPTPKLGLKPGSVVTSGAPGAPAVVSQFNADGSLYEQETVSKLPTGNFDFHFSDGSYFAGKTFSAVDDIETASGFILTQSRYDGSGSLVQKTTFNADGSVYALLAVSAVAGGNVVNRYNGSFLAGKSYASYAQTLSASGLLLSQTTYSAAGSPIQQTSFNPDRSVYVQETFGKLANGNLTYRFANGSYFAGKAFASYLDVRSGSGVLLSHTLYDSHGAVTQQTEYTADGSLQYQKTISRNQAAGQTDSHFQGGSYFVGKAFFAYDQLLDSNGRLLVQETFNKDGSHAFTVPGSGLTVAAAKNDFFRVTGGNDTISFKASGFGHDTFSGYAAGDTVSFAKSVFASYQDMSAHVSGTGSALITGARGDTLTLAGVAPDSLTSSMFAFV